MTKRPDDDAAEFEDGLTTSERRRRRRRAGIRIPSDNVPRRSGSGPVVAPVPEDPALAVSIAYAFGDEHTGRAPTTLPPGELRPEELAPDELVPDELAPDGLAPDGLAPDGLAPHGLAPHGLAPHQLGDDGLGDGGPRDALGPGDVSDGLGHDRPGHDRLGHDRLGHDRLGHDRLGRGVLGDVKGRGDDLSPFGLAADLDDETAIAEVPLPEGSVPMAIDDVVPDGRTRQMPAVNLEALGLLALDPDGDGGEPEATTFEPAAPELPDVTLEQPAVDPPVSVRPSSEAEAIDIVVDEPSPGDGVPRVAMPRAATVALSEDDLEELLEATTAGAAPPPPRPRPTTAPPSPPVERTRQTAPPVPSSVVAAAPAAPPPLVVSAPLPSVAPLPPVVPLAPLAPLAAAAPPAPEVVESLAPPPAPAAAADATDSSEILAEEILEVDERAAAVAPAAPIAPLAVTPSGPIAVASGTSPPPPPAAPKPPPAPVKRPLAPVAAAADDPKRKRRGKPWFEEVFDEDYLRTLPFLTPQATQFEANVVVESLGLAAGSTVLDLGCGYGRHAMELAARGMSVVGVDLSLPMLLRGADEAQRRGLDINFVHADMREIDFDAQFDGAYCLFSTFGYFDDETNKKAASLVAKALKPGAKFMLEVLNRDYVIGDLPTRVWWEGDGCVVLEEVEFNYFSSRVQSKRSVVFDDGRQIEQEISLRVYSLHEMGKLLHAAGLRVLEVSGSMVTKGRFLGNRSREIIVIAERRTDGKPGT